MLLWVWWSNCLSEKKQLRIVNDLLQFLFYIRCVPAFAGKTSSCFFGTNHVVRVAYYDQSISTWFIQNQYALVHIFNPDIALKIRALEILIAVFDVPTFQATFETDPLVFFMLVLILSAHKRSRGGQGLCYTHILAHQVILCFEKRYPKQNTAAGVTSKIVPPQKKFLAVFLTVSA